MALLNRQSLINYFKKGSAPSERHFADLIESTVNIVDDGISREGENGFRITPIGRSNKLISFYKNFKQINPEWSINLDKEQNGGLAFQEEEKNRSRVLSVRGFYELYRIKEIVLARNNSRSKPNLDLLIDAALSPFAP